MCISTTAVINTRFTVYQVTNLVNGKIYIGKHQTLTPNDSYYGSGRYIKKAIEKYGKDNFLKTILFDFDNAEEMDAKEKELVTEEFVKRADTYNLGVGGEGGPHFRGRNHSKESIEKGQKTKKLNGTTVSVETRRKLSASLKNRSFSEEHKHKLRLKALMRYGRTLEEAYAIISGASVITPNIRRDRSEIAKKYFKDPENRKKHAEACRKLHNIYDMDALFLDFESGLTPKLIRKKYDIPKHQYDHIRKFYLVPRLKHKGV